MSWLGGLFYLSQTVKSIKILVLNQCFEHALYANSMQIHLIKKGAQELIILKPFVYMAERGGFEPPLRFRKHAFQACAFSHSATSPYNDFLLAANVYNQNLDFSVF
jgi:hypothetical protein